MINHTDQISLPFDLDWWPLMFHTAINMQSQQLSGIVERKVRHAVIPRLPIDFNEQYNQQIPATLRPNPEPIAQNLRVLRASLSVDEQEEFRCLARDASNGVVTFINRSIDFGNSNAIEWNHEKLDNYPIDWRLKLQSFEFLEWLTMGFECPSDASNIDTRFRNWVSSWEKKNPIGEAKYLRRAWIPHSVSLRIINLCRYCSWFENRKYGALKEIYKLIFKNALFLANHVEYDIGGNHLIENAIALIMAGIFFSNHDTGWLEQGVSVLEEEADKQFLEDGGHFERSPMYHVMVLTRYLTAVDLLERMNLEPPLRIRRTAESGVEFLQALRPPDNRIPLLNDSVYGEELSLLTCLRYANQIGIDTRVPESVDTLDASGYYWLGTNRHRMLVDGGAVGPKHLPAHSHNDQLSFLLWVDGEPVITDTGTYEYAPSERRRYSRSVQAHNTVQLDNVEPIDIGGKFLMGQRSTPTARLIKSGQGTTFKGAYHKRSLFGATYTHERQIIGQDRSWLVRDKVDVDESFTTRLHFHPSVTVEQANNDIYMASIEGTSSHLVVTPLVMESISLLTTEYYPEFGVCKERETLVMEGDDARRCEFRLSIQPQGVHREQ